MATFKHKKDARSEELYDQRSKIYKHPANSERKDIVNDQLGTSYPPPSATDGIVKEEMDVCCGLCGSVMPYSDLLNVHLPSFHSEIFAGGEVELEEVSYDSWLQDKQQQTGSNIPLSKNHPQFSNLVKDVINDSKRLHALAKPQKGVRRVSQHRVKTATMSLPQLESALVLKMAEKLGRQVPVSLVDKLHAKCGICNAIVSLNKKFETMHLVRHFNAWHSASHDCSGLWPPPESSRSEREKRPLSAQDFALVNVSAEISEDVRLQCVWCGLHIDQKELARHFNEDHDQEIELPECNLCLKELVLNACFTEKYSQNFGISLPDEFAIKIAKCEDRVFKSVKALTKCIESGAPEDKITDGISSAQNPTDETQISYKNSKMQLGKHLNPKREFIIPIMRQAAPINSKYVQPISLHHWRCKLCSFDILACVISAGAIKHFTARHKKELYSLKLDICVARLEKLSAGKMKLVTTVEQNPETRESKQKMHVICALCSRKVVLNELFNLSRAIRHLKIKHPHVMPENGGMQEEDEDGDTAEIEADGEPADQSMAGTSQKIEMEEGVVYAAEIADESLLKKLRDDYGVDFERAYSIYGTDIKNRIYIICMPGDEIDAKMVEEIARMGDQEPTDQPFVVQYARS